MWLIYGNFVYLCMIYDVMLLKKMVDVYEMCLMNGNNINEVFFKKKGNRLK